MLQLNTQPAKIRNRHFYCPNDCVNAGNTASPFKLDHVNVHLICTSRLYNAERLRKPRYTFNDVGSWWLSGRVLCRNDSGMIYVHKRFARVTYAHKCVYTATRSNASFCANPLFVGKILCCCLRPQSIFLIIELKHWKNIRMFYGNRWDIYKWCLSICSAHFHRNMYM